jgi:molecular chaperone DnaJ
VRDSEIFEREGVDLAVDVPVSPLLAAVGGTVDIPTPDGMAQLKLAAGTPNGKLLRLRGKGMPDLRGGPQGDLLARIVFEVPQRLTGRQRSAMEELAKSLDASNFPEARAFADKVKVFYSHKDKLQGKK